MKTIYFVRHGESEANANNFYAGQLDSPLTEKGISQAKMASEKFSDIKIEKIVSSTLSRAKDTAREIRDNNYKDLEIETWVELMENNWGKVQGMEKVFGKGGPQLANEMGEGENEEELLKRAKKVLEKIKELKEDKILVVAHNSFLSVIFYILEKVENESWLEYRKKWSMKNAEIRIKEI